MSSSPTGRMMDATSKQLRTPQYQPSFGAQRVIDMYSQNSALSDQQLVEQYRHAHDLDFSRLESRVLAMPRALGAPYGTTAQRQWAKRERIHARLRIARKGH